MHMYGRGGGIVLWPGMAAMLPDGHFASGVGCLPLTPDELTNYFFCQSS